MTFPFEAKIDYFAFCFRIGRKKTLILWVAVEGVSLVVSTVLFTLFGNCLTIRLKVFDPPLVIKDPYRIGEQPSLIRAFQSSWICELLERRSEYNCMCFVN